MNYLRTRASSALPVALMLLAASGTALGQRPYNPDARTCGITPLPVCEGPLDCVGAAERCAPLLSGEGVCVPDSLLICCTSNADCPHPVGATDPPICGPLIGAGDDIQLCRQGGVRYCGDAASLTLASVRACHLAPDGTVGLYALGDCDGDGLTNAQEEANETDPCVAPPPRGFASGDACIELPTGCTPLGGGCIVAPSVPGECQRTEGGEGTECVPTARAQTLFCGNPFTCLSTETEVHLSGRDYCVPALCDPAMFDLRKCILDEEGRRTAFATGDCDDDGILNRDEVSNQAICDQDPTDAGVIVDAGARDGGVVVPADGGSVRVDGGEVQIPPDFRGTGGCVCRSARHDSRVPTLAGGLSLFLIVLTVWRRRR